MSRLGYDNNLPMIDSALIVHLTQKCGRGNQASYSKMISY